MGTDGHGPDQFEYPSGLALDEAGNVYVADMGNGRIQKFSAAGKFKFEFGMRGSGEGRLRSPQASLPSTVSHQGGLRCAAGVRSSRRRSGCTLHRLERQSSSSRTVESMRARILPYAAGMHHRQGQDHIAFDRNGDLQPWSVRAFALSAGRWHFLRTVHP